MKIFQIGQKSLKDTYMKFQTRRRTSLETVSPRSWAIKSPLTPPLEAPLIIRAPIFKFSFCRTKSLCSLTNRQSLIYFHSLIYFRKILKNRYRMSVLASLKQWHRNFELNKTISSLFCSSHPLQISITELSVFPQWVFLTSILKIRTKQAHFQV